MTTSDSERFVYITLLGKTNFTGAGIHTAQVIHVSAHRRLLECSSRRGPVESQNQYSRFAISGKLM